MASDNQPLTLMNTPLEVRHQIFRYVAVRDVQPKELLRYWFEKKEVKEKAAELAAQNPNAGTPRVAFEGDQYEEEQESEDGEDIDEGGDDEQDEEMDEDGGDEQDEDIDNVLAAPVITPGPTTVMQNATPTQPPPLTSQAGHVLGQGTYPAAQASGQVTVGNAQDQVDSEDEEADAGVDDDEADAQDDGNEGGEADTVGTRQPPIITVHRKWRHIPQFMRMTHCPPPVELLLASKQLNAEAKSWFYDVAILHIEATGSFAHTSFFEEAFSQITEAAFSPIEDIRKVEVTFVWDTTWLRGDSAGCAGAIFPALLRQRAAFVVGILAQAPNLNEVTIHWHDSAQDEESVDLMNDVLAGFLGLSAAIKVETHYIAVDAKPHKRSIAGRRRVEFQNIVDMGLDRLF